jgi:hypothetical protein
MLQPELTTKQVTGAKKARIVVNGAQEPYKEDEDNYAPTALAKGGQLLFALAVQEGRKKMGIDITCAFASESLTAEDGDIYVKFPDILVQHFGWKLDEQRQEQREVLVAEASANAAAELVTSSSFKAAAVTPSKFAEESNDEQSQTENASKGSRSKRRCQARNNSFDEDVNQVRTVSKRRSEKWEKRAAKWKESQGKRSKVRGVSHNSQKRQGYYAKLRKSLYGLRRAAKLFNRGLRELLRSSQRI